ncbi:MAG TPA: PIG-L family deacetylase [Solirubrobacterales bacterium]|nr:PIG-L family deacetylase [Solirubrobacterales bacterium]
MCAVLALACAAALLFGEPSRALAAGPCSGKVMYVAAHEDDTLLFQSPQLLEDVRANKCVQTVFTTAGDAGKLGNGGKYWKGREAGAEAAYAQMGAVANTWTHSEPVVNGHKVHLATLSGAPGISIVYLRLPDGGPDGKGFPPMPEPGGPSLTKLWRSVNGGTPAITEIEAVDGSAKYTYSGLVSTLTAMIESFAPLEINTQNYSFPELVGLDHSDHIVTGKFTQVAQLPYAAAHLLRGYQGYENFVAGKSEMAANVTGTQLDDKEDAFFAYTPHDEACGTDEDCEAAPYPEWLQREYVAGKESVPGANAGPSQTVVPGASVQLDGSGSFDPGDTTPTLTYAWIQTAGPKVTLSSPTVAKPTFTAPAIPTTLVFSLKVKNGVENGSHESLAASVAVNVENPPPPPPNNGGGGGGGNPPPPQSPKENIVVKLSKTKVKLVVGKQAKHVVKVIAPGKSRVKCRGQLPKGASCRVNAQGNVVIESSKSVKRTGTYHLVIDFAWQAGTDQRPLTVVFKRPSS